MAERNKMTVPQFAEHIGKMGASIVVMRERIRASLSWSDVIRRKFGPQITVANRDVDRMVASAEGQDDVELRIHRVLFNLPVGNDQKRLAQRLNDAEQLRGKFSGCKSMETMARGVPGARFDNLGDRRPSSLPEPTRSLLLAAHDDELLPATIGENGVELWAVCGRKLVKAADSKRETAQNESAPEGIRDHLEEAPEGSAYGRPHRVPLMGAAGDPRRRRRWRSAWAIRPASALRSHCAPGWSGTNEAWIPSSSMPTATCSASAPGSSASTVPITAVQTPGEASDAFRRGLPVLHMPVAAPVRAGVGDPANAAAVIAAIEAATAAVVRGEAAAIVTNPIAKYVLTSADFPLSPATRSSSPPWPSAIFPANATGR